MVEPQQLYSRAGLPFSVRSFFHATYGIVHNERSSSYAPLIWMFAGKTLISKICKIHHRIPRVVHNEYNRSYGELLQLNNNVSIHQRNLQYLALEVFKSLMHQNPEFMWSYFNKNPIPYDLRKGIKVFLPPVKSFRFGLNSIHFRGRVLWNNLPSSIKKVKL